MAVLIIRSRVKGNNGTGLTMWPTEVRERIDPVAGVLEGEGREKNPPVDAGGKRQREERGGLRPLPAIAAGEEGGQCQAGRGGESPENNGSLEPERSQ